MKLFHLTVGLLVFVSISCATESLINNKGKFMNENESHFDFIKKPFIEDKGASDALVIELKKSERKYFLERSSKQFNLWSSWLKEAYDEHRPVYIVNRVNDGIILGMHMVSLRRIDSITMSQDNMQLKVGMLPSPSYYHVSVNLPRFNEVQEKLRQALNSKEKIYIVLGNKPLEIIDAQDFHLEGRK